MYHIFKVNNYKGGELDHDINLEKEDLIELISEFFECPEYKTLTLEQLTAAIESKILSDDNDDKYADGKGLLFETNEEDGSLMELEWVDFAEDIAKQLIKWRE